MKKSASLLSVLLMVSAISHAQTFKSSAAQTSLIELFSSQGCSSCPAAEHWVSELKNKKGLWADFIPLVFHVDYWNYLGWRDPFSNAQNTFRQRQYHAQAAVSSVYTPGMLVNGKEWRAWYRAKTIPETDKKPGILIAKLDGEKLAVTFKHHAPLNLNVALLGFGIKTDIQRGENSGKVFFEDFVVLNKKTLYSKNGQWQLDVPITSDFKTRRYALAIWVNKPDNLQPIQSVGGWIKQ